MHRGHSADSALIAANALSRSGPMGGLSNGPSASGQPVLAFEEFDRDQLMAMNPMCHDHLAKVAALAIPNRSISSLGLGGVLGHYERATLGNAA